MVGIAEWNIEESSKEDVSVVVLNPDLLYNKKDQLFELLNSYGKIFLDVPGKIDVIEQIVKLSNDKPVTSWPYWLPNAVRKNLKTEISDMIKMGVIRETTSPYASPIVIV